MKRWYQLSMLQLLVAMAVVAVMITLNLKVRRVEVLGMWVSYEPELEIQHLVLSAGWPFTVVEAITTETSGAEPGDFQLLKDATPAIQIGPLIGNIAAAIAAVCCAVAFVGTITRRCKPCPSPST